MGNESSTQRSNSLRAPSSSFRTQPAGTGRQIVVVNATDSVKKADARHPEDELFDHIRRLQFGPLIAIGSETVPATHLQLNHVPFSNICRLLQKVLRLKAQTVHKEQVQLAEMIREIDFATAFLTSCFVDRERRLQRVLDAFGRLNQIISSVSRCERSMGQLEQQVNQLNQLLPPAQRLETLALMNDS